MTLPADEAELVAALFEAAESRRDDGQKGCGRRRDARTRRCRGIVVRDCPAHVAPEALLVDADPWSGGIDLVVGSEDEPGLRWPDLALERGRIDMAALRQALPGRDKPPAIHLSARWRTRMHDYTGAGWSWCRSTGDLNRDEMRPPNFYGWGWNLSPHLGHQSAQHPPLDQIRCNRASGVRQRADRWIAGGLSYGHYGEATAKLGETLVITHLTMCWYCHKLKLPHAKVD